MRKWDSLAQYEEFKAKFEDDEELQAIVQEIRDGDLLEATSDRRYQVRL